jgi:hypothetical protein
VAAGACVAAGAAVGVAAAGAQADTAIARTINSKVTCKIDLRIVSSPFSNVI